MPTSFAHGPTERQLCRSPEDRFHRSVGKLFFPAKAAGVALKANHLEACAKRHSARPAVRSPAVRTSHPGGRLIEVLLRIAHGLCRSSIHAASKLVSHTETASRAGENV